VEYAEGEVTDHGNVLNPGDSDGLTRPATGRVGHGDCTRCRECVDECPVGALSVER
jgi:ferredoxin